MQRNPALSVLGGEMPCHHLGRLGLNVSGCPDRHTAAVRGLPKRVTPSHTHSE